MSTETIFLSVDNVLSIHQRLIAEFGGGTGIRNNGLLEAAAAMPKQRFRGTLLHNDLAEQAAAYLYHLCCNRAFIDGNKQTALAAAEFFLQHAGI
ncbi:MAG: Fic family protein [Spirochaetaceae bacterium]|nr:Fic family protein [Spirochaetaceae bacterium]